MKFMVRAVSRDRNGKAVDIANTWPLPEDVANAFELTDASGNSLAWRPFRMGRKDAVWS